jgi:hypothetical protein
MAKVMCMSVAAPLFSVVIIPKNLVPRRTATAVIWLQEDTMSRLPDISQQSKPDYSLNVLLWFRLDPDSQYALQTAYKRITRRKFLPPGQPADLAEFDAAKEMQQAPESEEYMRR